MIHNYHTRKVGGVSVPGRDVWSHKAPGEAPGPKGMGWDGMGWGFSLRHPVTGQSGALLGMLPDSSHA